jgi:hypothetical protein
MRRAPNTTMSESVGPPPTESCAPRYNVVIAPEWGGLAAGSDETHRRAARRYAGPFRSAIARTSSRLPQEWMNRVKRSHEAAANRASSWCS